MPLSPAFLWAAIISPFMEKIAIVEIAKKLIHKAGFFLSLKAKVIPDVV